MTIGVYTTEAKEKTGHDRRGLELMPRVGGVVTAASSWTRDSRGKKGTGLAAAT